MNPLRDDKAPYAIALLLGAFGWHTSQISKEVRESKTVIFTVERDPASAVQRVVVENVTNKDYIQQFSFEVSCPDMADCLDESKAGYDSIGWVRVTPKFEHTSKKAEVEVSLPPGAGVAIKTFSLPGTKFPNFKYTPGKALMKVVKPDCDGTAESCEITPEDKRSLDVLVIDGNSWRGWLVNNYLAIVLVTFALVCFLLLFSFFFMFRERSQSTSVDQQSEP